MDDIDPADLISQLKTLPKDNKKILQHAEENIDLSKEAIETLNKLVVQDKKSNTTIKAKQLDIDSKKQLLAAEKQSELMLSREEVLDRLLKKADVIDINQVEPKT